MRRNLWGRLERLETGARRLCNAVRLRDGTTAGYTTDEALEALGASIRREPNALLGRLHEADTTEGLPGLCRALEDSRERVARGDTRG